MKISRRAIAADPLRAGVVRVAAFCSDPGISTREAWTIEDSPNSRAAVPVIATEKTAKRSSNEKLIHLGIPSGIMEIAARKHSAPSRAVRTLAMRRYSAGSDVPLRRCDVGAVDGCYRLSTAVTHYQPRFALKNLRNPVDAGLGSQCERFEKPPFPRPLRLTFEILIPFYS